MSEEWRDWQGRIEELEAMIGQLDERERLMKFARLRAALDYENELQARAEAAEAREAKLVEALSRYGMHENDCPARLLSFHEQQMEACTCGLSAVLATVKEGE